MKTENAVAELQGPQLEYHDLFSREVRPPYNWKEWIDRWNAATTSWEMLGLLHGGFETCLEKCSYEEKEYTWIDRVAFYFKIADGWTGYGKLDRPGDGNVQYRYAFTGDSRVDYKSPGEMRQVLAGKAYDMICQNILKHIPKYTELHRDVWRDKWSHVVKPDFVSLVTTFFRLETDYDGGISVRNIDVRAPDEYRKRSHNEELAISYLLTLFESIWDWREREIESWYEESQKAKIERKNATTREYYNSLKPWMIEVLNYIGQTSTLSSRIMELDETSLNKLREIAMRKKFRERYNSPVLKERPVETLEEACLLNSSCGWLLKRREILLKEMARLKKIREIEKSHEEAEEQRQKAEERLKQLRPQTA